MKKLEIIIKPEKLEDLKGILDNCGAHGLMISNIMGYGTQKGYTQMYRGTKYTVNLLPKVKVETVVTEEIVEAIISKVTEQITTGNYGDGKIFVCRRCRTNPYRRARRRSALIFLCSATPPLPAEHRFNFHTDQ